MYSLEDTRRIADEALLRATAAAAAAGSPLPMGGDVTGTTAAAVVIQARGGVFDFSAGGTLLWSSTSTWLMSQAPEASATKAADSTWQPQQSTHAVDQGGGNANINLQAPAGAGLEAYLNVQRGGSTLVALGALVGSPTFGAVYLGGNPPSATNWVMNSNGVGAQVQAPLAGGQLSFGAGGAIAALYNGTSGDWRFNAGVNVQVNNAAGDYGGGLGVIGIHNATTNPTTNPTNGGILYVSAGALTYRGSGGTVTPIAPA